MNQQIEPFYDKDISCPFCQNKYTSKKLRSKFTRVNKVHSDFYTEYKDAEYNPYLYEVYVCPACGYAHTDAFSNQMNATIRERIAAKFADWSQKDFGGTRTVEEAIDTYKLALLTGTVSVEKHVVLAGLCMRLAWLFRLLEDKQEEQRFLELALKQYESTYTKSDYRGTKLTEIRLLYIIGELHRRTGKYNQAVQYYSMVASHQNRALEQNIVNMARDAWSEAREEAKLAKAQQAGKERAEDAPKDAEMH